MATESAKPKEPYWLIYGALLFAGLVLLADAYNFVQLNRWTARLGLSLVFSAVALFVGNGKTSGIIAVIIIWLGVILAFVL